MLYPFANTRTLFRFSHIELVNRPFLQNSQEPPIPCFFNNRNLCSVTIEEELDIVSHNVNIIAICQRQSKSFLAGILDAASDNYEKCVCSIFKQDQDRGFCHNYLIWI